MNPARAFFASMSVCLLALTLSYQATAIPAALAPPPPPPPKTNAWMDHAEAAKGNGRDDLSELAPLLDAS